MDTVQNPELTKVVTPDSPMKEWLLNYVGEKASPENDEVTTEMIVETMASEFPEFLMVIAEENWIRGYHQAMADVEMGEKLINNLSETKDENNGSE